jgi:hypothetical protein
MKQKGTADEVTKKEVRNNDTLVPTAGSHHRNNEFI